MQPLVSPTLQTTGSSGALANFVRRNCIFTARLFLSGVFLIAAAAYAAAGGVQDASWLALAAGFVGYMALNIGASDVANNLGPAVGARAIPMKAALAAAAICLNLDTVMAARVWTTPTVVGGVLGAGIAAAGVSVVEWAVLGDTAVSRLISSLFGAGLLAACLCVVKRANPYQTNLIPAASRGVPLLAGAMASVFTIYR